MDERTKTPFSALFTLLSQLPRILSEFRELKFSTALLTEEHACLHEQIVSLRRDLLTWRDNPAYADLFRITTQSSEEFPYTNLIYESNKAVSLLLTYSAMIILINSVLIFLSGPEVALDRSQNVMLGMQICQSYESSRKYSPIMSLAMDFAFRVAYLVPDVQLKRWILEKMNETASSMGGARNAGVTAAELEGCFDDLRY